jgi:hypothetical protein
MQASKSIDLNQDNSQLARDQELLIPAGCCFFIDHPCSQKIEITNGLS